LPLQTIQVLMVYLETSYCYIYLSRKWFIFRITFELKTSSLLRFSSLPSLNQTLQTGNSKNLKICY